MLKRVFYALAFFAFMFCAGTADAKENKPGQPDQWALSKSIKGVSTTTVRVDQDGNFYPGMNLAQTIGESTHAWIQAYIGQLYVDKILSLSTGSISSDHEVFLAIPDSSTDAFKSGGLLLSTFSLTQNASVYYYADVTTQPVVPRDLIVFSSCTVGVGTTTLIGNVTFYGLNAVGNSVQEMITFSTTIPTSTDLSTGGLGVVAFASISSFSVQLTSVTDVFGLQTSSVIVMIGEWNKIGLSNVFTSTSDVYNVVEGISNVPVASTGTGMRIDVANSTIYFKNPPNSSRNYQVWYRRKRSSQ
jgi:hypothetical protein